MIQRTRIEQLYGLVGHEQPANPDYALLDADNISAGAEIVVNDISPHYKIESLYDVAHNYHGVTTSDFNKWLKNFQINSLLKVGNDVFKGPDASGELRLFTDFVDEWYVLDSKKEFRGYEIEIKADDKSVIINRVFSYFENAGNYDLLLFNQFKKEPLKKLQIAVTDHDIVTTELNWILESNGDTSGGKYYIGYLANGLVPKALNGYRCMNQKNGLYINEGVVAGHNTETIFEEMDFIGSGHDYGLNFDITVANDYTNVYISNKSMFARAVALDMAIKAIKSYQASIRSNPVQEYSKEFADQLTFEIEGNPELKIYGLKQEYKDEIKSLKKSFSSSGYVIDVVQK